MTAPARFLITPLSRESIARIEFTPLRTEPSRFTSVLMPSPFNVIARLAITALTAWALLMPCSTAAQNVGDYILPEKTASTGRTTNRYWPKGASKLWGTNGSSLPASITIGSGLSLDTLTNTLSATGGGGGGSSTLAGLTDVTLSSPANNQLLRYNSASSKWINWTPDFLVSSDLSGYLTSATAATTYQPLDADLTSIAALTTTTFGRSLLTQADASATRTTLGLGTLATQSGTISDYLTTATAATTYQPLDADLTSIAALTTTAFGRDLLTYDDAMAVRTALELGQGDGVAFGSLSLLTSGLGITFTHSDGVGGAHVTSQLLPPISSDPYIWNLPVNPSGEATLLSTDSNLNASKLSSGTVADARLSANVTLLGSSISLASEVTGTLPIANGGTGQTTASAARVALLPSMSGHAGKFLQVNGTETDSAWVAISGGGDALTTSPLSQFASTTSAQLAGVISDETGSGSLVFGTSPTLTTPSIAKLANLTTNGILTTTGGDGTLTVDTTTKAKAEVIEIGLACSDETTAITAGTGKVTFRSPCAFTLTAVRGSATTAATGSTIVIDINEAGTSVLSTKLSLDASEKTSTTAASAAVISDSAIADDAEITIDFDQVGSGTAGTGIKVWLIGTRN